MALRRKARKKSSKAATAPKASPSSTPPAASAPSGTPAKSATGSRPSLVTTLSDPRTVRRLLLAARVIGPVVAAGAMKTSTGVRGVLDDRRARQLGVPVEDVAAYKGPAGTVQARITGLSTATADLRARRGTDPRVSRFADTATARLTELSAAVSATQTMPSATRRSALRAASADLDQLDAELMTFLVGPPTA